MPVEDGWFIRGEVYEARVRRYQANELFQGLFVTENTNNQDLVSPYSCNCALTSVYSIPSRYGQGGGSQQYPTTSTGRTSRICGCIS